MSVSVSFKNSKTLGSGLTKDSVLMYLREALTQLQNQADTQGVELDWNRAVIKFGDEYTEEYTLSSWKSVVCPELSIHVPGEGKDD